MLRQHRLPCAVPTHAQTKVGPSEKETKRAQGKARAVLRAQGQVADYRPPDAAHGKGSRGGTSEPGKDEERGRTEGGKVRNKKGTRSPNPDRSGDQRRGKAEAARIEGAERSLDRAIASERKRLAAMAGRRSR